LIIGHAYEVAGQAGDWAWAARSPPIAQRRPSFAKCCTMQC
jgi:hypothetical protein